MPANLVDREALELGSAPDSSSVLRNVCGGQERGEVGSVEIPCVVPMRRSGAFPVWPARQLEGLPASFPGLLAPRNSAQGRNWLPRRATPAIPCLGQGNLTAMALKNHLFPNVIAPRNHASELHPLGTSRARRTMIRWAMVLGHVPIMDDSLANLWHSCREFLFIGSMAGAIASRPTRHSPQRSCQMQRAVD